jgi:CRP/FNR family transcriptional regulator, dissimilatory nitrate respiration regulator
MAAKSFDDKVLLSALESCALFKGFESSQIKVILPRFSLATRSYSPQSIIAFEEDECTWLGIILNGSIKVEHILASGKTITLDTLGRGTSFGEALIFADLNRYPATIQALEYTEVLYLSRKDIIELCRESDSFLSNFSALLSNRLLMLNRKVKSLSFTSIRQRVINYLLEEYQRQKTLHLTLTLARHELANLLGIPRPSLSRELAHLQADGLIQFDRQAISLLSIENLEKYLFQ